MPGRGWAVPSRRIGHNVVVVRFLPDLRPSRPLRRTLGNVVHARVPRQRHCGSVTPERAMQRPAKERVKAVFQSAVDRETPAERKAFLNEACGTDAALRGRVDALLAAHDNTNSLLDQPAAELLDAERDDLEGLHEWLGFLAPPSK